MTKISELPEEIRKFVRKLIRAHCRKNEVYKKGQEYGVGLEQTEETVEKLIDEKKLFIGTDGDKENPTFWIEPR